MALRSRRMWDSIWPEERLDQRAVFNFGMEVLLALNLADMRLLLGGFFKLSRAQWAGFLSWQLSAADFLVLAATMFVKGSTEVKAKLLTAALPQLPSLAMELGRARALPPAAEAARAREEAE